MGRRKPRGTRIVAHLRAPVPSAEKVPVVFVDVDGEEMQVEAESGDSILDVAHENDIEIEGACGGECACSTCHVVLEQRVYDALPAPTEEEEDMLDLALGLTKTSRLGCQIKISPELKGIRIQLPRDVHNLMPS